MNLITKYGVGGLVLVIGLGLEFNFIVSNDIHSLLPIQCIRELLKEATN